MRVPHQNFSLKVSRFEVHTQASPPVSTTRPSRSPASLKSADTNHRVAFLVGRSHAEARMRARGRSVDRSVGKTGTCISTVEESGGAGGRARTRCKPGHRLSLG